MQDIRCCSVGCLHTTRYDSIWSHCLSRKNSAKPSARLLYLYFKTLQQAHMSSHYRQTLQLWSPCKAVSSWSRPLTGAFEQITCHISHNVLMETCDFISMWTTHYSNLCCPTCVGIITPHDKCNYHRPISSERGVSTAYCMNVYNV